MSEEFRKIIGFEDYSVSNHGRVRRDVTSRNHTAGKILKPYDRGKIGYLWVQLSKNKVKFRFPVHRLVLSAFVGPQPSHGYECNHKDGNKSNNFYKNIEWATHSENMAHAHRNGFARGRRGAKSNLSKLKSGEVWLIKRILSSGAPIFKFKIAEMFGVHKRTIYRIQSGDTWA